MTERRLSAAKAAACDIVDHAADELIGLSHDLHSHPELAGKERRSARRVGAFLAKAGFPVEAGTLGLPTAFRAAAGPASGPHVVVCCEYDALPGLGHACGHNVIAAAGAGAGLALRSLARMIGARVTVLGTPAEERMGGKISLARRGAFAGVDAVLLVHPSSYETAVPRIAALATLEVGMIGRASHAGMFPERGVNALDALVLGYMGLASLRQHLRAGERVHGIVIDGGTAPNIVPARSAGRFLLRAPTRRDLGGLAPRVLGCFAAGSLATGARFEHRWAGPIYAELRPNAPLAAAYVANARLLGRRPLDASEIPESVTGSTDLGNVSHLVPALHPMLAISPPGVVPHTPGFAAAAAGPAGDQAVLDGAKALAMTALDIWCRPELRAALRRAHLQPPFIDSRSAIAVDHRRGRSPASAAGWPVATAGPDR